MKNRRPSSHIYAPNFQPELISNNDLIRSFLLAIGGAGRRERTQEIYGQSLGMLSDFARAVDLPCLAESCRKKKQRVGAIERRVGRLLEGNSRAAGFFKVEVRQVGGGGATVISVVLPTLELPTKHTTGTIFFLWRSPKSLSSNHLLGPDAAGD